MHQTAKEDDLICILYGCGVPVVLRKHVKKKYQILAEEVEDKEVLDQAQKEVVNKFQPAYLERCDRIRTKKLQLGKSRTETAVKTGKSVWALSRHTTVFCMSDCRSSCS